MNHRMDRTSLNFWSDKELKLEAAHLLDLCEDALNTSRPVWTPFLSQALGNWFEGILRREGLVFRAEGGLPDAERARFLIGDDHRMLDSVASEVKVLRAKTLDPHGTMEHRQILGSLMGMGLKREVIGDIRVGEHCAFVAVAHGIADVLLSQWDKAGRERIQVELVEGDQEIPAEQGEERRITVASSRIDAVASSSFNVSRSIFQEHIKQGKVKRNDLVVSKTDLEVKQGDILSCRGYGRVRLVESMETRKGRIAWNIIRYIPRKT
ncbi:YlmH/Sll1252 family protein [Desulfitobacterium sp. THU1]|uniref:YlmH family RNA-binding protein n=1 Tax=Desulfitobacterium sp. THU1 TaxID=3138072 RepID=UPI00311D6ED1